MAVTMAGQSMDAMKISGRLVEVPTFVKAELPENPTFVNAEIRKQWAASSAVNARPWFTGVPAKPGWYNASSESNPMAFRFFDGKRWSVHVPVHDWPNKEEWLYAKSYSDSGNPGHIRWRAIKPYRDGEEWDFLRE